jgi:hypothetical protein
MSSNASLKEQRDYAWSYFQLHANQRISSFNFFVVIAALLTTGLAGTLKSDFTQHYVGVILALSLIVISFIFWKMDQWVRYLIKHAEEALKAIEEKWMSQEDFIGPALALFRTKEEKTENIRGLGSWNPWQWHLSYANCFGAVYLVFGVLGVVGGIAAVIKWTV